MSSDGKYIYCGQGTPDWQGPQQVDRVLCLTRARGEVCHTCPGSRFVVRIQLGIGNQVVACPRWEKSEDQGSKVDPVQYVQLRRGLCLQDRPFSFCASCPNSNPSQPPRTSPGWVEKEERERRFEADLEEEELE